MVIAPDIKGLVQRLTSAYCKEKVGIRRPRVKSEKTNRKYTLPERNSMVVLRHGSLEDFTKVMYSYYYIAKVFKSTYNVVHRIISRFKARGVHDDMRR